MVVEYMDRAQGATGGFSPQNLRGTHTSSAESSGRRYVAAERLGDGPGSCCMAPRDEHSGRGSRNGYVIDLAVLYSCCDADGPAAWGTSAMASRLRVSGKQGL